MQVKNFLSIEALRAWMAWWVVVGHAVGVAGLPAWIPEPIVRLLSGGGIAVNVFIIVSGFVITHLLLVKREVYPTYLARRWFRIFPVYLFCICLSILVVDWYAYVFIDPPWNELREMRVDRAVATEQNWYAHLVAHISMLHGVIPDAVLKYSVSSILAPAWSISLEWQFYIVAPLLFYVASRGVNWAGLLLCFLFSGWVLSGFFLSEQYQYPAMLFLSIQFFIVGIFSRLLLDYLPVLSVSPLVLFVTPLPVLVYFKSLELIIWLLFYIFCLLECFVLKGGMVELEKRKGLGYWFAQCIALNPLIRYLGRISYSTYLVHIPVFVIVAYLYGGGVVITQQGDMLKAMIIAGLVCVPVSAVLYHSIEMPFIKFGARFVRLYQGGNSPSNSNGQCVK